MLVLNGRFLQDFVWNTVSGFMTFLSSCYTFTAKSDDERILVFDFGTCVCLYVVGIHRFGYNVCYEAIFPRNVL